MKIWDLDTRRPVMSVSMSKHEDQLSILSLSTLGYANDEDACSRLLRYSIPHPIIVLLCCLLRF